MDDRSSTDSLSDGIETIESRSGMDLYGEEELVDELIPTLESAITHLEAFLDEQRSAPSPAGTLKMADLIQALAMRAAEAAAAVQGFRMWDDRALSSEEVFDNAPVPLLLTDAMGFVEKANRRLLEMSGASIEELIATHVGDFIHHDDYNTLADIWVRMQVETDFDAAVIEFRLILRSGIRWQRATIRATRDSDRSLTNLIVHFVDIDNKYEAVKALKRSERSFGNLLDSLPDPIVRVNRAFEVQFSNPAAKRFHRVGTDHEWPRVLDEDASRYIEAAEECWLTGETHTIEHGLVSDGESLWCETTFVAETGGGDHVESLLVIWRDHTSRHRHEELLAHRAAHDPLTGLPNRSRFAELLDLAILRQATARELGQDRPLAVLFLDLDRFKFVNDSLGHLAGDELLKDVASRLVGTVRPGDFIGRLGGDEFTILAEDITAEDAVAMAERIQASLMPPFDLEGREFIISASIGVVSSAKAEAATDLMRWADSAMYKAKSMGQSKVATFEEVLGPDMLEHLETDQMIRTAVERDELELYFQPEVMLDTGQIVGTEALVRWNHPTKGFMPPDQFIPIAEDNGSIIPIGSWVLRHACEQTIGWERQGLITDDFVLRVNLSPRQLDHPNFVELVASLLSDTGFAPSRLCLEITETALMREVDQAMRILGGLSELGLTLAVDDFGTGYSSLSSLKRFPISVLKIDRSFIDGLPDDTHDAAIVRTILRLSQTLNLVPTAEGVETEEQRAALKAMGCPRGQGYLFARPMPASAFEELLRHGVVGRSALQA